MRVHYLFGYILKNLGDFAEARTHYEGALTFCEKTVGPDHRDAATICMDLGALLLAQGDLAVAKVYFERALKIFDKLFGSAHPDTRIAAGSTVNLLAQLGHAEEAQEILEKFHLNDTCGA